MFYTIQKEFDDAIRAISIPVNARNVANTDSIKDGVEGFSLVSDIVLSEEQVGEHTDFDFIYNFQFVTALPETSEEKVNERKLQAQKDYLDCFSTLKQTISTSSAINVTFIDGEFDPDTKKDYQSWGVMRLACHCRVNTCKPVVR